MNKKKALDKQSEPILTPKGIAIIAWINCGLAPKVEGGYDDETFERFWAEYERLTNDYLGKLGFYNGK